MTEGEREGMIAKERKAWRAKSAGAQDDQTGGGSDRFFPAAGVASTSVTGLEAETAFNGEE